MKNLLFLFLSVFLLSGCDLIYQKRTYYFPQCDLYISGNSYNDDPKYTWELRIGKSLSQMDNIIRYNSVSGCYMAVIPFRDTLYVYQDMPQEMYEEDYVYVESHSIPLKYIPQLPKDRKMKEHGNSAYEFEFIDSTAYKSIRDTNAIFFSISEFAIPMIHYNDTLNFEYGIRIKNQ